MPTTSAAFPFIFWTPLTSADVGTGNDTALTVRGPGPGNAAQYAHTLGNFTPYVDVYEYRGIMWAPVIGSLHKSGEFYKTKIYLEFHKSADVGQTWTKPYAFDLLSPTLGNAVFAWGYQPIVALDPTDASRLLIGYYADPMSGWNTNQSNNAADFPFTLAYLHMDTGVIEVLPVASGGPTIDAFDTRHDATAGIDYYIVNDDRQFARPQMCGTKIIIVANILWFSPIASARNSQYWAFNTGTNAWDQTAVTFTTDIPADVGTHSSGTRDVYTTLVIQPTGNSSTAILAWKQTEEQANSGTGASLNASILKARTLDLTTYTMGSVVTLDSSATTSVSGLITTAVFPQGTPDFSRWIETSTDEWWTGLQGYAQGDYGTADLPTVWRVKLSGGTLTTDYFRISTPNPWYSSGTTYVTLQKNGGVVYAIASGAKHTFGDAVVLWSCNPAGGNTTFADPMEYFSWELNWNDTIMGSSRPPLPVNVRDYWPFIAVPRLLFGRISNYIDSAAATNFCM